MNEDVFIKDKNTRLKIERFVKSCLDAHRSGVQRIDNYSVFVTYSNYRLPDEKYRYVIYAVNDIEGFAVAHADTLDAAQKYLKNLASSYKACYIQAEGERLRDSYIPVDIWIHEVVR